MVTSAAPPLVVALQEPCRSSEVLVVASESDSEQLVVPSLSLQPAVISSSQAFFALVWVVNVVSKGADPVVQ